MNQALQIFKAQAIILLFKTKQIPPTIGATNVHPPFVSQNKATVPSKSSFWPWWWSSSTSTSSASREAGEVTYLCFIKKFDATNCLLPMDRIGEGWLGHHHYQHYHHQALIITMTMASVKTLIKSRFASSAPILCNSSSSSLPMTRISYPPSKWWSGASSPP